MSFLLCLSAKLGYIMHLCHCVPLTRGATPSGDVAGVVVGQDLTEGRQGAELDVVVERSFGGQTQESDVEPEDQTSMSTSQGVKNIFSLM